MSLYAKMAQIMGEINHLPKTAHNDHFQYWYTPDVVVYDECRRLMSEKGIALFASMTGVEQQRDVRGTNKDGSDKIEWHTLAHFEFVLVDSESGENMTCTWAAEANDGQDKGVSKCATAGLKYWLLKTFMISTGDDPEAVDSASAAKSKRTAASRPSSQPASKPAPSAPPAPDFEGHARAKSPPTAAGEAALHWSTPGSELRANFDRAMKNNQVDETAIKIALGSEDPAISIDRLLLQYETVGTAIAAVLTYIKERAAV